MIANRFNPLGVRAKPYAYELQWLESTDGQYIDTGFIPTDHSLEFEWCADVVGDNATRTFWGLDTSTRLNSVYYQNNIYFRFFNRNQNFTVNPSGFCTYKAGPDGLYFNGEKLADRQSPLMPIVNNTLSLWLFALRAGTTASPNHFMNGKFAWQKVSEFGKSVLDLIPVVDKSGVVCIFDKVSQQFFYNQGTGEFTAGERVN